MQDKLLLQSDVIKVVDKHTNDRNVLDDDISCILGEIKPVVLMGTKNAIDNMIGEENKRMKVVKKVAIELTNDEYETLIKAQIIWKEMANNLDEESLLTDTIEKIFDDMDNGMEEILNIVNDGISVS